MGGWRAPGARSGRDLAPAACNPDSLPSFKLSMIFEKTQGGLIPNAVPIGQLQQARSSFKGARVQRTVFSSRVKRGRLETQNFKFMKKLGVKKPAFLPDFGLVRAWRACCLEYTLYNFNGREFGHRVSHAGEEKGCAGQVFHQLWAR